MGLIHIELTPAPILMDKEIARAQGEPSCGAVATFTGTTRLEQDGQHGALVRLDYEAYEEMARGQMRALAQQAIERWSLARVVMVHRIGAVFPGEASVVIAVACGHRVEAFESCRWLIDALKQEVPIWKKDIFADGFVRWVDPGARRS